MASWDEVKSRIKWAGKASVVKLRTAAKTATVNGKISDAKKSLNGCYLELGRCLVDTEYKDDSIQDIERLIERAEVNGADTEVLEAVREVKKCEKLLANLLEEKVILKGITPCRVCGAEVTADSEFCSKCGARVVPDPEAEYEEDELYTLLAL